MDNVIFNNTNAKAMGVTLLEGAYEQLVSFATPKEGEAQNWADQHGTDWQDGEIFYESRVLNLPIMIEGSNETDLQLKVQAFKDFLRLGYFILKCQRLNRQFKLRHSGSSTITWQPTYIITTITVKDDFPNLTTPYA